MRQSTTSSVAIDPTDTSRVKVPAHFICRRCGAVGDHRISECPTQGDPEYDRYKMKKTTGIPRDKLRQVNQCKCHSCIFDIITPSQVADASVEGAMLNPSDNTYWVYKTQTAQPPPPPAAAESVSEPPHSDFVCSICENLMRSAVKMPCCETSFCDECKLLQLTRVSLFPC